jgi:hypothetical protein
VTKADDSRTFSVLFAFRETPQNEGKHNSIAVILLRSVFVLSSVVRRSKIRLKMYSRLTLPKYIPISVFIL